MIFDMENIPSRQALLEAEQTNCENGHELMGFLSEARGFLPLGAPMLDFPGPHHLWDEVAAALPEHVATASLRKMLVDMPVLDAGEEELDAAYVQRALTVLGVFAHAYYRLEGAPAPLPPPILRPWQQVCARAGRFGVFLSFYDFFFYNWRYRDASRPLRRVENLDLMVRTVPHYAEAGIGLTIVETMDLAAPMLGAMVRAQEALVRHDLAALKNELLSITAAIQQISAAFANIDLNPYSRRFSDPIKVGKCISIMWEPIEPENSTGVGGTETPFVPLIDAFIGRSRYATVYGQDQRHKREQAPPHVRKFLHAIEEVSLRRFLEREADSELKDIVRQLLETYTGDKGFLKTHLLKAYGYMATGMRCGRLRGLEASPFATRLWDVTGEHLFQAQDERRDDLHQFLGHANATLARSAPATQPDSRHEVRHLSFDLAAGMFYEPGDCLGILPEHDPALVERTLAALEAGPQSQIGLNKAWRSARKLMQQYGKVPEKIPLTEFLRHARIRPVDRQVITALHRITVSPVLKRIMDQHGEDQWELWDMLEAVAGLFDVKRLWQAEPWQPENLSNLLSPEAFRHYSIASAYRPGQLDLTVGGLHYTTEEKTSCPVARRGAASSYVHRMQAGSGPVAVQVLRKQNFQLPDAPEVPIIMFAAGTGVAPFRGFLQQRLDRSLATENWLLYSVRRPEDICHREEIDAWLSTGRLRLDVQITGADLRAIVSRAGLNFEPGSRARVDLALQDARLADALWEWIRPRSEGGREAVLYVCGSGRYAEAVYQALKALAISRLGGTAQAGRFLYQIHAARRYQQDIYTTFAPAATGRDGYRPLRLSEIARHNNAANGYWIVIDDEVYDVTEFVHLHPGGDTLVLNCAGSDATREYRTIRHHQDPGIQAMLSMYKIGYVEKPDLAQRWGIVLAGEKLGYVSLSEYFQSLATRVCTLAEMENAHAAELRYFDEAIGAAAAEGRSRFAVQAVGDYLGNIVNVYLLGLMDPALSAHWRITVGLCVPEQSFFRMDEALDRLRAAPPLARIRAAAERWVANEAPADAAAASAMYARLTALHAGFLAEMKEHWIRALLCCERHGETVLEQAGAELAAVAAEHPARLEAYLASIDAVLCA